ncbi:DUF309 domain-containing protein [Novipirellula caenicola]|uniref:DUF309 domain-containing protein n=1 Tax=Novipirellula caenicola TaxID=1536901 RepID=UPI0031F13C28
MIPPLPPRLSSRPFPPYAFVPGMHPHPVSGVGGHRYQCDEDAGMQNPSSFPHLHYLAIDLLNHGYYWESHEAWETIWKAAEPTTMRAAFVKGLIKLAAAGVKARQGSSTGVRRHSERAAALFAECDRDATFCSRDEFGITTGQLSQAALQLAANAEQIIDTTECPVRRVLPFVIAPDFAPPVATS